MTILSAAFAVAAKDLRMFLRDRMGLLLGFLLPIVLVTAFGFIMKLVIPGGTGGMPRSTLWISDADGTEKSRELVEQLRKVSMLRIRPEADEEPLTHEDLRAKIDDGEAHHGLVIEVGFGTALDRGELPELLLMRDPGRVMEDRITRIGLAQAFMAVTRGNAWPHSLGRILGKSGMDDQQVATAVGFARSIQGLIQSFAEASDEEPAVEKEIGSDTGGMSFDMSSFMDEMVPVRNEDVQPPERPKQLSYQLAQSVCGIMVMMVMFLLMACGATLIQEREGGTLPRIMASAIPRSSLLLGKSILGVTIGFVQLLVLCAYGQLVFQVDMFRDIPTLLVISLSWTVAATSFGMLIASWAQTTKQAEGLSTLLILLMAAIGGCWFPVQIFDLPLFAQIVTKCSLAYWAMSAYQGMLWHQRPWFDSQILVSLGVLWGFAVAASLLAVRLFRMRYLKG